MLHHFSVRRSQKRSRNLICSSILKSSDPLGVTVMLVLRSRRHQHICHSDLKNKTVTSTASASGRRGRKKGLWRKALALCRRRIKRQVIVLEERIRLAEQVGWRRESVAASPSSGRTGRSQRRKEDEISGRRSSPCGTDLI